MTEATDSVLTPSSVVVVPEPTSTDDVAAHSTTTGVKRRTSCSTAFNEGTQNKRRRLSNDEEDQTVESNGQPTANDTLEPNSTNLPPPLSADANGDNDQSRAARGPARALNSKDEERKRGRRLFGSLLGTLSQSSSSSSTTVMKQKQRADIDRKQQEKLKLQTEEYNEERRRRLDELTQRRKNEQVLWDKQTRRIRHQNLLATANFLSTKTLPKLYYRPWDLTVEEKAIIQEQIEEAEKQISRETEDAENSQESPEPGQTEFSSRNVFVGDEQNLSNKNHLASADDDDDDVNKNTSTSTEPLDTSATEVGHSHVDDSHNHSGAGGNTVDNARDNGDEIEEVMLEAGEDAVIW